MNMKQKLLLAVIATACAAPTFAADGPTATQDVSVTVNKVNLISVAGTTVIACSAPTSGLAGDFLNCTVTDDATAPSYKLTSNGSADDSHPTQQMTAMITQNFDPGLGLNVAVTAPGIAGQGTTAGVVALDGSTETPVVTAIKNVATGTTTGKSIAYSIVPVSGTVPAYHASAVTKVRYTITNL